MAIITYTNTLRLGAETKIARWPPPLPTPKFGSLPYMPYSGPPKGGNILITKMIAKDHPTISWNQPFGVRKSLLAGRKNRKGTTPFGKRGLSEKKGLTKLSTIGISKYQMRWSMNEFKSGVDATLSMYMGHKLHMVWVFTGSK